MKLKEEENCENQLIIQNNLNILESSFRMLISGSVKDEGEVEINEDDEVVKLELNAENDDFFNNDGSNVKNEIVQDDIHKEIIDHNQIKKQADERLTEMKNCIDSNIPRCLVPEEKSINESIFNLQKIILY